jgi:cytochrome c-type biogenesis protein CcmH/NrfF
LFRCRQEGQSNADISDTFVARLGEFKFEEYRARFVWFAVGTPVSEFDVGYCG